MEEEEQALVNQKMQELEFAQVQLEAVLGEGVLSSPLLGDGAAAPSADQQQAQQARITRRASPPPPAEVKPHLHAWDVGHPLMSNLAGELRQKHEEYHLPPLARHAESNFFVRENGDCGPDSLLHVLRGDSATSLAQRNACSLKLRDVVCVHMLEQERNGAHFWQPSSLSVDERDTAHGTVTLSQFTREDWAGKGVSTFEEFCAVLAQAQTHVHAGWFMSAAVLFDVDIVVVSVLRRRFATKKEDMTPQLRKEQQEIRNQPIIHSQIFYGKLPPPEAYMQQDAEEEEQKEQQCCPSRRQLRLPMGRVLCSRMLRRLRQQL